MLCTTVPVLENKCSSWSPKKNIVQQIAARTLLRLAGCRLELKELAQIIWRIFIVREKALRRSKGKNWTVLCSALCSGARNKLNSPDNFFPRTKNTFLYFSFFLHPNKNTSRWPGFEREKIYSLEKLDYVLVRGCFLSVCWVDIVPGTRFWLMSRASSLPFTN